ncbi:MAG UNVERIFIED_CONTAM: hypothetical protein LVR18_40160 [Planctomycetaceae bacterium]
MTDLSVPSVPTIATPHSHCHPQAAGTVPATGSLCNDYYRSSGSSGSDGHAAILFNPARCALHGDQSLVPAPILLEPTLSAAVRGASAEMRTRYEANAGRSKRRCFIDVWRSTGFAG